MTIFFYNPNIHPRSEYELRKKEQIRYAEKLRVPFVDADYDPENWFERIKGFEEEPERGKRCQRCFDMRFERTALYAFENHFKIFTTTLGLSRWKDLEQVHACGRAAAAKFPHLIYWDYNWRKQGGSEKMYQIAKEEHFYKQEYCGCQFSLQKTNLRTARKGRNPISSSPNYY